MRTLLTRRGADAAQLRQELDARGLGAIVIGEPDAEGRLPLYVPDTVDGIEVDGLLRSHFPRTLIGAIAAIDFDGMDFTSSMTVAATRAECEKLRLACKRLQTLTIRAMRARWEG